jgi:hypothetical protein
MSVSMYDLTIPTMLRGLSALSGYLDKASAYATDAGFDPSILINARLAPDMLSLAGQVQRTSDNAKGGASRLTGTTGPSFPDTETTFPELVERIAKTTAFLRTFTPENFEGSESRAVELKFKSGTNTFRGDEYLLQVMLPNFYFHIAMAHAILRHNGLKIGKLDYLSPSA